METPIEAILEMYGDDAPGCCCCEIKIDKDCHFIDPFYACERCFRELDRDAESQWREYARKNCKITEDLPEWDATTQWSITPEDYESGARESNTENAYRTTCRHEFTNYDELISSLDRFNPLDSIQYSAIRGRIDELIFVEIQRKDLIKHKKDQD